MTKRDRPRLNITLSPDLKDQLKQLSEKLNLSVSRLIEEVMYEFLDLYEQDPMVGSKVKKSIIDRKKQQRASAEEEQAKEEIEQILDALESGEITPEN